MKAWLYNTTPVAQNLTLDPSARTPQVPTGKQVLVKVLSAALNPADYKIPNLLGFSARFLIGTPASPGQDFCGRIVGTGPLAQHLKEGQLVFGCYTQPVQFGSLAEYVLISADNVAPVPDGVRVDDAAGLGLSGQTAYQCLEGRVSSGQSVLINGGSGGCGIFAIQIAKELGCRVTATCSTKNVELCFRLGADDVVDYSAQSDLISTLSTKGMFDVVIDFVGETGTLYYQSHMFLKEGGEFVQVGGSVLGSLSRAIWPGFLGGGQRKYVLFKARCEARQLVQLGQWVADRTIQVQVDGVYEFQDVGKAFERLGSGRARGKIVVRVNDPNAVDMQPFGIGL